MNRDADPQPPEGDDRPAPSPSVRDDALSWLRTPLTMRQLCALGVFLVGGGIPIALVAGGWAWLGLGAMVIIIIAMAMAHERGLRRRRHRPRTRALKRTRGRRRSGTSEGEAPRRTGTRRRGRSGDKALEAREEPPAPRPDGDLTLLPTHTRRGEPARRKVPRGTTKKQDHR